MDLRVVVGVAAGLVALWALIIALLWLFRPRGVGLREALAIVPDLLRLIRSLIGDSTTPLDVRAVLVAMLVWIVSPIDLIPEFIPVIGPLDDVAVAVLALRYTRRRLGIERLRSRWTGSGAGFDLLVRAIGTGG
jgi:uncharacterized membrane protein YkvA (DUF1232 family)